MTARVHPRRLACWVALVATIAGINYYARFSGSGSSSSGRDEVYSWSGFAGGMLVYGVWLGIVLAIAIDMRQLLALQRPRSWRRAAGYVVGAIVAIYAVSFVVSLVPLPQSPSNEQGLTPAGWEPRHAAAFFANVVLFAGVAPFVEELTFRGVGQSLLRFLGRSPSLVAVGVAFGITHGLVEALLVLVPFGIVLAFVRERTESVYPGMIVHALFNATALTISVL